MINLSTPNLIGNELKYLNDCINTGWISTAGKYVDRFEKKISRYTNSKYAIACINATVALQISLKLLNVKAGDEVIVPTLTFISPINAVLYNNASPIFMDCDKFCNIDIEKTIEFIVTETKFVNGFTYNKKTNKKISALIVVHVWGNAVWLDKIKKICLKKNIKILEDASESLGSYYTSGIYKGKFTGTIGDIGCISFNGNKIITSGGGGVILTNNKSVAKDALYLTTQAKDDSIKYIHNNIGYNYRLTNVHAAIGLAQIEKIKIFLKNKKNIHTKYLKSISKISGLSILKTPSYAENNCWLNILKIDPKIFPHKKEKIMSLLHALKIQTRPIWHLNHRQKFLRKFQSYKINNAYDLVKNSLCIPSSSHLNKNEFDLVVAAINNISSKKKF